MRAGFRRVVQWSEVSNSHMQYLSECKEKQDNPAYWDGMGCADDYAHSSIAMPHNICHSVEQHTA